MNKKIKLYIKRFILVLFLLFLLYCKYESFLATPQNDRIKPFNSDTILGDDTKYNIKITNYKSLILYSLYVDKKNEELWSNLVNNSIGYQTIDESQEMVKQLKQHKSNNICSLYINHFTNEKAETQKNKFLNQLNKAGYDQKFCQ